MGGELEGDTPPALLESGREPLVIKLAEPDTPRRIIEDLQEASYQVDRSRKDLESQSEVLRNAQGRYMDAISRAPELSANEWPVKEETRRQRDLELHDVHLRASGPVETVERATCRAVLSLLQVAPLTLPDGAELDGDDLAERLH